MHCKLSVLSFAAQIWHSCALQVRSHEFLWHVAYQARVQGLGAGALAEVASLCLERLLALGRSLAASTRYGKPTDDGIQWPQDPHAVTAMLRGQVRLCLLQIHTFPLLHKDGGLRLLPFQTFLIRSMLDSSHCRL